MPPPPPPPLPGNCKPSQLSAITTETSSTQPLIIRPEGDLSFKDSLGSQIVVNRLITNTSDQRLLFQVSSNGARRFQVKPGRGFVDANKSMRIRFIFYGSCMPAGEKVWFDVHHQTVDAGWEGTASEAWAAKTGSDGCTRLWSRFDLELMIRPEGDLSFKIREGAQIFLVHRTITNESTHRLAVKVRSNCKKVSQVFRGVGFIDPEESVPLKFAFDGSRLMAGEKKYWVDIFYTVVSPEFKGSLSEAWATKTGSDRCIRLWCDFSLEEDPEAATSLLSSSLHVMDEEEEESRETEATAEVDIFNMAFYRPKRRVRKPRVPTADEVLAATTPTAVVAPVESVKVSASTEELAPKTSPGAVPPVPPSSPAPPQDTMSRNATARTTATRPQRPCLGPPSAYLAVPTASGTGPSSNYFAVTTAVAAQSSPPVGTLSPM